MRNTKNLRLYFVSLADILLPCEDVVLQKQAGIVDKTRGCWNAVSFLVLEAKFCVNSKWLETIEPSLLNPEKPLSGVA